MPPVAGGEFVGESGMSGRVIGVAGEAGCGVNRNFLTFLFVFFVLICESRDVMSQHILRFEKVKIGEKIILFNILKSIQIKKSKKKLFGS